MEDRTGKLEEVAKEVATCHGCDLYKTANKSVPGEGNPVTKVMFIGEAPGYFEDQAGRPFVGQAGKLLDQLLVSICLKREEVFIANMVRHRPPNNRDPMPAEIEACSLYLDRQINIIEPAIIVTLGRFSMNKFLPEVRISQVHGQARFVDFSGKRYIVIPMYHPAAALRSGQVMQVLKTDFLKIKNFLNEKPEMEIKDEETKKE